MIENQINETAKWYEIIFENWAQIVVIVGVIGYIIRLFVEYGIKKKEISYLKIQELKIEEFKLFFKSYYSLRIALEKFLNQTEFGEHSKPIFENLRKDISTSHLDFEYQSMTIKLFIVEKEVEYINKIHDVLKLIKRNIECWHIYNDSPNPPENWDRLDETRDIHIKETLPELIKKIELAFRKSYNIK